MLARQVARLPEPGRNRLHLFLIARHRDHDHEGRQILVQAAEAVAHPGAEAGLARDLVAGLDVGNRRLMVDRLGVHRADDAHVVGHFGSPGQHFRDRLARLAVAGELVFARRDREAGLAAGHGGQPLAVADRVGQIFVVPVEHLGLVVVEVHLRGAADHVQVDDALGLGREVGAGGGVGAAAESRQGRGAEREAGRGEELAAGFVADVFVKEAHDRLVKVSEELATDEHR